MPRRSPLLVLALCSSFAAFDCLALSENISLTRASRGAVDFTHANHYQKYDVKCEKCHHNMQMPPAEGASCKGCHLSADHRGLCHQCHISNKQDDYQTAYDRLRKKLNKEDVPNLYRAFHSLCRNCHITENAVRGRAAPVDCSGCHR